MARAKSQKPPQKPASNRAPRKAAAKAALHAEEAVASREETQAAALTEAVSVPAVVLPEMLDASCAAPVREMLLARRGSPLVVDAGQVRRTGTQAIQILIAAARTWRADGQRYVVTNPSSEFLDTIALVGLTREQLMVEGFPG